MRSYLKVRKNEFCEQKLKNIREKKTKNCEKFPLFRAFKKQTKKKLKKCQKQPYFFMQLIFLPLLWIIENTLPKRSYLNSTNGEKTKCILCDVNVLLLQFSSENKKKNTHDYWNTLHSSHCYFTRSNLKKIVPL